MKIRALALVLATFTLAPPPVHAAAGQDCSTYDAYVEGDYYISAWNQNFAGWQCRTWDVNDDGSLAYLWINLEQTTDSGSSGYDAGVGRNVGARGPGVQLGSMQDESYLGLGVGYATDNGLVTRSGGGWYVGPKTIISSTEYYSGLDDQYECYIIDNASKDPDDFAEDFGLDYVSEGIYSGATYKHYERRLGNINQVFSIRQDYRTGGDLAVNEVQRQWVEDGLVPSDHYNLGWKVNVETEGLIEGEIGFYDLDLPWNR